MGSCRRARRAASAWAERFNTGVDAFDLLTSIGRDRAGALQLLPEDQAPSGLDRIEGAVLDEGDIERRLLETALTDTAPSRRGTDDGFRFALSGTRAKTAFLRGNGQWYKPHGSTPSTHIFMLPLASSARVARTSVARSTTSGCACN